MAIMRPFSGARPSSGEPIDIAGLSAPGPDGRYGGTRGILESMLSDGSLSQDGESLYLYEQVLPEGRRRTGAVAAIAADGVMASRAASSKEKGAAKALEDDTGFQLEPVVCFAEGLSIGVAGEELSSWTGPDGTVHRLLRSAGGTALDDGTTIIATDGLAALEAARGSGKDALAVVFPMGSSMAGPVHVMVDTGSISEKNAVKGISKAMELTEAAPEEVLEGLYQHRIGLVFKSGKAFFADGGPEGLDSKAVQDAILNGVYKSDEGKGRVSYSSDAEATMASMEAKEHDLAVFMRAPDIGDLVSVLRSGKRLQKGAASFGPGIAGLVVRKLRRHYGCMERP